MATWFLHPFALLHRTAHECQPFRSILRQKLLERPCSVARPWGLILYFDEVSPLDPRATPRRQNDPSFLLDV